MFYNFYFKFKQTNSASPNFFFILFVFIRTYLHEMLSIFSTRKRLFYIILEICSGILIFLFPSNQKKKRSHIRFCIKPSKQKNDIENINQKMKIFFLLKNKLCSFYSSRYWRTKFVILPRHQRRICDSRSKVIEYHFRMYITTTTCIDDDT